MPWGIQDYEKPGLLSWPDSGAGESGHNKAPAATPEPVLNLDFDPVLG